MNRICHFRVSFSPSFSKRVLVRSFSYENYFDFLDNERSGKTHSGKKLRKSSMRVRLKNYLVIDNEQSLLFLIVRREWSEKI